MLAQNVVQWPKVEDLLLRVLRVLALEAVSVARRRSALKRRWAAAEAVSKVRAADISGLGRRERQCRLGVAGESNRQR